MTLRAPEAWRQSSIARFDQCPLSLKFDLELDMRQVPGQMGQLGARGVLFHRFAAAAVNHMRAHRESKIGVDIAMELLTEIIAQRDVEDEEVVLLSLSELRWLRVLVTKWAYRHEFSIERVVAVERRLNADIEVTGPNGERYLRTITGQPDLLLAGPGDDEATVLDWKSGFAGPPQRRATAENPEPEDKLSDMGYVQQTVYGWLVMKNYPAIERVTEREYYVMAKEDAIREATVWRWELERIEDVLAAVVSQMDAAVESTPRLAKAQAKARKEKEPIPMGRWFPVPGTHCGFCIGRRHCPVREHFGVPKDEKEAQRLGREWHVSGEMRKERTPYLKGWVDRHGPIPIAHAKGRRVVSYKPGSNSLSLFEPEDGPVSPFDPALDPHLEAAAREAGVLVR